MDIPWTVWPALTTLALCGAFMVPAKPPELEVRPLRPPVGRFGYVGFEVRAPWMTGWLRMRMPETLRSSLGLHFIDHDRPDMRPLSMPTSWPGWTRSRTSGAIGYRMLTPEGIEFRGTVTPRGDRVDMEFRVRNRTKEIVRNVGNQMCLVLTDEPAFGQRNSLERIWCFRDGKPFFLTEATPTPREKGRDPWVLVLTAAGRQNYGGPKDYPDGWWVLDQSADQAVLARTSTDGKHLVAIAWDDEPLFLMSNTRIPCLHAGPTRAFNLAPGKECVWRGSIWLMENDPQRLLRAVQDRFGKR